MIFYLKCLTSWSGWVVILQFKQQQDMMKAYLLNLVLGFILLALSQYLLVLHELRNAEYVYLYLVHL